MATTEAAHHHTGEQVLFAPPPFAHPDRGEKAQRSVKAYTLFRRAAFRFWEFLDRPIRSGLAHWDAARDE